MSLQEMVTHELARLVEPPLLPAALNLAALEANVRAALRRGENAPPSPFRLRSCPK